MSRTNEIQASDVSVVVVSFNTRDQLRRCLSAIEPEHQVIVVDNASADGSAAMVRSEFPQVQLIENLVNKGFGVANNQGLEAATRPLALFLNSDCYAEKGAIDALSEVLRQGNPHHLPPLPSKGEGDIVAVGGRLLNPDGSLQQSASHMLNLGHVFLEQTLLEKVFGGYWCTPRGDEVEEVGQVMGACLMIRTGSVKFDECYFLYCEDTDLIYRLKRDTGGKVLYVPSARFTHELGASSKGKDRWLSVARYNAGKERFFTYHSGAVAGLACLAMNRYGALLRLALWTLVNVATLYLAPTLRERVWLWARVLTAPRAGPPRPDRTAT